MISSMRSCRENNENDSRDSKDFKIHVRGLVVTCDERALFLSTTMMKNMGFRQSASGRMRPDETKQDQMKPQKTR